MLIYNIEEIYTTSKNVENRYEKTNPLHMLHESE